MESGKVSIPINVEGLDEAIEKAKRLGELLKEAKSLANDIRSLLFIHFLSFIAALGSNRSGGSFLFICCIEF